MKESSSGENSRYRTDSLFGLSKVLPVHDTIPQALLTLSLFTFAKSAIIPLTFHLTRFLNPFYSEPNCLLRLVNETAPAHYEAHQYWRQLSYDNTCTDLKSFVLDQFNDYAQIEFKVWQVLGPAMFFTACIAVVYPLLTTNPNLGSTKAPALSIISASVLPCHFTMAAMFMYVRERSEWKQAETRAASGAFWCDSFTNCAFWQNSLATACSGAPRERPARTLAWFPSHQPSLALALFPSHHPSLTLASLAGTSISKWI